MNRELRGKMNDTQAILSVLLSNFAYDPSEKALAAVNAALKKHEIVVHVLKTTERYSILKSSGGDIYVCIRGSATFGDWSDNLTPGTTKCAKGEYEVHQGFYAHASSLEDFDAAMADVAKLARSEKGDVIFTGHSLGGAVAQLKYVTFLDKYPDLLQRTSCYTFGAPLMGNKKWQEYCNKKTYSDHCYNIVNELDGIPGWSTTHGSYSLTIFELPWIVRCYSQGGVDTTALHAMQRAFETTTVLYESMGTTIVLSKNWVQIRYITNDPTEAKKQLHLHRSRNAHSIRTYMRAMNNIFKITNPKSLPKSREKKALAKEVVKAVNTAQKAAPKPPPKGANAAAPPPRKPPTPQELADGLKETTKLSAQEIAALVAYVKKTVERGDDDDDGDDGAADSDDDSSDDEDVLFIIAPDDSDDDSSGAAAAMTCEMLDQLNSVLEEEIHAPFGDVGVAAPAAAASAGHAQNMQQYMRERFASADAPLREHGRALSKRAYRNEMESLCELARFVSPAERDTIISMIRDLDRVLGTTTTVPASVTARLNHLIDTLHLATSQEAVESDNSSRAHTQAPHAKPREPSSPDPRTAFEMANAEANRLFNLSTDRGSETTFNFNFADFPTTANGNPQTGSTTKQPTELPKKKQPQPHPQRQPTQQREQPQPTPQFTFDMNLGRSDTTAPTQHSNPTDFTFPRNNFQNQQRNVDLSFPKMSGKFH